MIEKMCPLMRTVCLEQNCAWWVEVGKGLPKKCAIAEMAETLFAMYADDWPDS
jgi:hypothetical protein|tara:strand:- start:1247 stop:1405 length:159 start_codon:yes stop_codon:yes gene_type:complete